MELDQDTKDKLLAVIAGKPMQRMLASEWHDCTMGEALEWLGKDFMRGHIRIKPQVMCSLGGIEYPMPMSAKPANGDVYYIASLYGVGAYKWRNDGSGNAWLAVCICHATKEAAEAHSKALRAVNAQAVEKAHAGGVK
jgi:hypothetical protein